MGVFCVAVFTLWHQDLLLVVWSIRESVRSEVNCTARYELNSNRVYLEYKHILICLLSQFITETPAFPLINCNHCVEA
jgi:hypothetical protein